MWFFGYMGHFWMGRNRFLYFEISRMYGFSWFFRLHGIFSEDKTVLPPCHGPYIRNAVYLISQKKSGQILSNSLNRLFPQGIALQIRMGTGRGVNSEGASGLSRWRSNSNGRRLHKIVPGLGARCSPPSCDLHCT